MLVVTEVDGVPLFYRLSFGLFDTEGVWDHSFTVPPGLYGMQLVLTALGFNTSNKITASKPQMVTMF